MTDDTLPPLLPMGKPITEAEWSELRKQELEGRKPALAELQHAHRPTIEDAREFLFRWDNSPQRPFGFIEVFNAVFAHRCDAGECFWPWIMEEWDGFDLIPHAEYERLFRRCRGAWSVGYMPAEARLLYDALPARFGACRGRTGASAACRGRSMPTSRQDSLEAFVGYAILIR